MIRFSGISHNTTKPMMRRPITLHVHTCARISEHSSKQHTDVLLIEICIIDNLHIFTV